MGRSRSRTPSRKPRRRSSSRSKHSKKSRHRTPERKSSKYRHRSASSSESSANRHKSSSKYHSKRRKHDSKSPPTHRSRRYRRSSSSSKHSSRSSSSNSSTSSQSHRSSSSDKRRNKPSSSYMDKIRSLRTPTPPPSKLNFDASMEFLDKRHVSDSLTDINADEFRPKAFSSSSNVKKGKSDADILKVKGETRPIKTDSNDDPLFHENVFGDDDTRMEQWIHRVYTYRQKMFTTTN